MDASILLLRPDRAGDAIKTLPALRALRRELPDARIGILASEHNASLFAYEPGIELFTLPANWAELPESTWLERVGLSTLFPSFKKVINLLSDPSPESILLLNKIPASEKFSARAGSTSTSPIHWIDFPDGTPAGRDETENAAHLLSQALWIDVAGKMQRDEAAPFLHEQDHLEASEKMGKKTGQWLGLNPSASHSERTLPTNAWKSFLKNLTSHSTAERFFLFGIPADYSLLMELRAMAHDKQRVELCFPSSFRALGAYLIRLDGVIAVDSGPLHLARALKIPTLGFLSGGDADRWFPGQPSKSLLVRRGWLSRHPTPWQMHRAYRSWGV